MEKGKRVEDCVRDILQCLFVDTSEDPSGMIIERAHRVPTTRFPPDRRNTDPWPRHILVRFLQFTDREKVRLRAKELGQFQWKDNKVFFFPDFSKEVQDRRNKFTEVRSMCVKGVRLQYSMQYPAVFWVTVGGKKHWFEDAPIDVIYSKYTE